MRAALWSGAAALLVLVGLAAASVPGTPEPEGQPFWLTAKTRGTAIVAAPRAELADAAYALRFGSDPPPAVALALESARVTIERHEHVATRLVAPTRLPLAGLPDPEERVSWQNFSQARMRLDSAAPHAAIAVAGPRITAWTGTPFEVAGVVVDPLLRGFAPTDGSRFNPDEVRRWTIAGPHLSIGAPDRLEAQGPMRLYWSWASLTVNAGGRAATFESRAWEEVDPTGTRIERHIVWHELTADGTLKIDPGPSAPAQPRTLLFARGLDSVNASWFSLDGHESLETSLPTAQPVGAASVWSDGVFDVALRAQDAQAEPTRFTMDARGTVTSAAIGGGSAFRLTGAVVAPTLVGGLVAALIAFRDAVLAGGARVGFLLYSKLTRHEILESPNRDLLYRIIRHDPGISFLRLREATASGPGGARMSIGTLLHHLDQLERFGLVLSRRVGRFRRYFDAKSGDANRAPALALLRNDPANLIARTLVESPGLARSELQRLVSMHRPLGRTSLMYHLHRLAKQGLVAADAAPGVPRFHPTQLLVRLLPAHLEAAADPGAH